MNPFASPAAITPPRLPTSSTRSRFITLFGWCIVIASILGCIVSLAALLMLLAGGSGRGNASLLGGFVVIGLPPLTLLAGVGWLRRWRWAYGYVLLLVGAFVAWNIVPMIRGPKPEYRYVSATGVPTTVLASDVNYPAHLAAIAVALGLLGKLLTRSVRDEFPRTRSPAAPGSATMPAAGQRFAARGPADGAPGWRAGHQGRDELFYEEWRDGAWQRLRISGEMLMGRAHHVIYFASPEDWRVYPEWARGRREEIIGRIKSVFCPPDYEYDGDSTGGGVAPEKFVASSTVSAAAPFRVPATVTRRQSRGLALAIAVVLVISGVMGWLVVSGLIKQQTYLPTKHSSQRRMIVRAQEPVFYWTSLGFYALVGGGTFYLGIRGIREARRLRRT